MNTCQKESSIFLALSNIDQLDIWYRLITNKNGSIRLRKKGFIRD